MYGIRLAMTSTVLCLRVRVIRYFVFNLLFERSAVTMTEIVRMATAAAAVAALTTNANNSPFHRRRNDKNEKSDVQWCDT